MTMVLLSEMARARARLTDITDFPTPPFPPAMGIIFLSRLSLRTKNVSFYFRTCRYYTLPGGAITGRTVKLKRKNPYSEWKFGYNEQRFPGFMCRYYSNEE
jgi:hypothetical protein